MMTLLAKERQARSLTSATVASAAPVQSDGVKEQKQPKAPKPKKLGKRAIAVMNKEILFHRQNIYDRPDANHLTSEQIDLITTS